ncbi:MAG: helix-turn-helix domain-containing protein [Bdellovibrionales bacterium]|jgi:excisionase family DNA binding protein|nr:helix-turn-helix domain-containing protein [Bdellovibrionales bacterium]
MNYKNNYNDSKKSYTERTQGVIPSESLFNIQIPADENDENGNWLNTKEAASFLRITPNALRILVHRARVKYYKLGSHLRFKHCDLLNALQLQEV